jgi:predicted metal-binding protein
VTQTPPEVTLHICTTCRKLRGPGRDLRVPIDTVAELEGAAQKRAQSAGVKLACERTGCLSGCQTGLTVMIETPEGMVRLQKLARAEEAAQAVAHAQDLVDGTPVDGLIVLSRVKWSEWDADGA